MYKFVVARNEQLTPGVLLLTLAYAPHESKVFGFHPGQYAAISFGSGLRRSHARCFSIASSPLDQGYIQFGIRVGGAFTHALQQVQPGELVEVRGPFGGFVVDPQHHRELVLIAGGIGITPFMSMLRFIRAASYPYSVRVLYGVQDQHDIPFYDELARIAGEVPNITITFAVSRGNIDALHEQHVVQGRVDGALLHEALEGRAQDKTVFICGPPPMMKSMVEAAAIRGVPENNIITEAFKQGKHRQTGKIVSWPRNMYIMGGVGVALGAFVISVIDIVDNLPSAHLTNATEAQKQLETPTSRSSDLDTLVNTFAAEANDTKTASPTTIEAQAASTQTTTSSPTQTPTTTTATPTTTTSTAATPTTTPTPAPAPDPTPAPAPAPTPVCTTSQSGVTTCV